MRSCPDSVEKSIGLPKNQAVENSNFPDVLQSRLLLILIMKQRGVVPVEQKAVKNNIVSAIQQALANADRSELTTATVRAQDRSFEPSTALVDGLYCLEYSVDHTVMGKKAADKSPSWFHSFFSIFKKPSKPKCSNGKYHTFEYKEPSTKETKEMTFNDAHAECLMCPEVTQSLPNPSPFSVEDDKLLRFYFPFLYVENKRATKSLHQALHQCQMYCIFGVEFLAALGITDFPVFGVITAGTEGEIIMAWKSSKSVEADYHPSYPAERVSLLRPLMKLTNLQCRSLRVIRGSICWLTRTARSLIFPAHCRHSIFSQVSTESSNGRHYLHRKSERKPLNYLAFGRTPRMNYTG